MTCSTLTYPEDLKILIREGIAKLCPPDIVPLRIRIPPVHLVSRRARYTGALPPRRPLVVFVSAHAPRRRSSSPTGRPTRVNADNFTAVRASIPNADLIGRHQHPERPPHSTGNRHLTQTAISTSKPLRQTASRDPMGYHMSHL